VAGRVAKPLSFARRFEQDLERIEAWYLETADERVAEDAVGAVPSQAKKIARLGLAFRPGYKNTRECSLTRFPFLLIYRIEARAVKMLRVINSRGAYLNERARREQ
jgi:plasmid stabilization system protein ParE